jgi:hypothetical protein
MQALTQKRIAAWSFPMASQDAPPLVRISLVASVISPVFLIWALKGNAVVSNRNFVISCLVLFALPNFYLGLLVMIAKRKNIRRTLVVQGLRDRREDVVATLLAILLPFFTSDLDSWQNILVAAVTVGIVCLLLLHARMYYFNPILALLGAHCYEMTDGTDDGSDGSDGEIGVFFIASFAPLRSTGEVRPLQITKALFLLEKSDAD